MEEKTLDKYSILAEKVRADVEIKTTSKNFVPVRTKPAMAIRP